MWVSGGGGGAPAVTERTWFWSFGRPKTSIRRFFCHSERTWFWRFGRLKISILRAFCHSYVGLGAVTEFSWGGGGASDRNNLVLELWEAQNLNFQVFLGGASAVTERGGGGAPAVTERTWFWSFGRLKISILRAFCHSHVVGGGIVAIMH